MCWRTFRRYGLSTRKLLLAILIFLAWTFLAQYTINIFMKKEENLVLTQLEPLEPPAIVRKPPYFGNLENITVCGCYNILLKNLNLDHKQKRVPDFYHYETMVPPIDLLDLLPHKCVNMVDVIDRSKPEHLEQYCFRRKMSKDSQMKYVVEAKKVMVALQKKGIWLSLADGSVLGSVRLHGFLPWDDDMDFIYMKQDREKLKKSLQELGEKAEFQYKETNDVDKGLESLGILCAGSECQHLDFYPIDLQLKEGKVEFENRKYDLEDIVPLKNRPFNGQWFPAPARPLNYLRVLYGETFYNHCAHKNHKKSRSLRCRKVHCSKLKNAFAHAEYCAYRNGWTTELQIEQRKLLAILIRPSEN